MSLGSVLLNDAAGAPVSVGVIAVGSVKLAAHIFVDATGAPTGTASNPLLTAPGIRQADFTARNGSITVAGAVALDIPANAARIAGSITAPVSNTGNILVTLKKSDGVTTIVFTLHPGDAFSMVVNPGYVLPHEIAISGTVVGDTFLGVEFS